MSDSLPDILARQKGKPGSLVLAGIVCGMLAFGLLFAPILPVTPGSSTAEALQLPMPENAPPPEALPGPERRSLIAAILPTTAPPWLTGGPGRASVASVMVARAKTALGLAQPSAPAKPIKGDPGKPEPAKAAADAAFKNPGKLSRVGTPATAGATSASASANAPAAKLGLVDSSVGNYAPVGDPNPLPGRRGKPQDSTAMVQVGRRPAVASAGPVAGHEAVSGGAGAGPGTGARESLGPTALARVPDAVAARDSQGYGGPGGFSSKPAESKNADDAHDVDKKLITPSAAGPTQDLQSIIASLFASLPTDAIRKRLQDMQDEMCTDAPAATADCDLMHICLKAGIYSDCERACRLTPGCQGTVANFPPTPAFSTNRGVYRVGDLDRTITLEWAAPNQPVTVFCESNDGRRCTPTGPEGNTRSDGTYSETATRLTTDNLCGPNRDRVCTWCAWATVGSGSNARTTNKKCVEVHP